jgi:hypothetical protein
VVASAAERRERHRGHRHFVHRCVGLVEPAPEPPHGVPLSAVTVAQGDERRQLECLGEVEAADRPRLELGDGQVAALQRSTEDGSRVALGSREVLSWGRTRRR